MLPSFWLAKSEPGKDAGSVRIDSRYGRDRGHSLATLCSRPEAGGHLLKWHSTRRRRKPCKLSPEPDEECLERETGLQLILERAPDLANRFGGPLGCLTSLRRNVGGELRNAVD